METTWDGVPIAREPPFAVSVVVWREAASGREFLVLHRLAPGGIGFEGEWAWTPPSGARQPDEVPELAAARELHEETGLRLRFVPMPHSSVPPDVALFAAQAPTDAQVVLDAEHDEYLWLSLDEAVPKCLPPYVGESLMHVSAWIDLQIAESEE